MKEWIFTFGAGQPNEGHYVRVFANDEDEARQKMIDKYGKRWSFQYSKKNWDAIVKRWEEKGRPFPLETEIDVIK
jgi:hypothetical protein